MLTRLLYNIANNFRTLIGFPHVDILVAVAQEVSVEIELGQTDKQTFCTLVLDFKNFIKE